MGFSLTGFAVGAAENVAESLKDERERAQKLVDDSLSAWTELGLDEHRNRKIKRKTLTQQATTLKSNGFTPDMMDVIFREGSGEQVIKHIETMKQRNSPVTAADIVKFTPGVYEKSGKTQEQVIDEVMGKIDRGMTASDAIADATGTDSRGVFGIQNLSGIMKRRTEAFSNSMGLDATDMRALAMQDFDYGDAVQGGSVNLVDPVAEAQAKEAVQGSGLGASQEGKLGTYAETKLGVEAKFNPVTNEFLGYTGTSRAIERAQKLELEATLEFDRLMETGDYTKTQARIEAMNFIDDQAAEFHARPKPETGVLDKNTGKPTTSGGLPNYSGIGMSELPSRITQELQGVTDPATKQALVRQAEKVLQDALIKEQGLNVPKAGEKAREELKRILNSLK